MMVDMKIGRALVNRFFLKTLFRWENAVAIAKNMLDKNLNINELERFIERNGLRQIKKFTHKW